eukprot:TRINITY_DN2566_c1_g3_i2.p1 TRINITY_DN2566_c1_g3~~TRINITY_DN2566_c1_g3_i2.p1  ORF type:complete len:223 (+),score=39.73 TRINITY_DN2566_c1_g3_i2:387-1055(+)
MSTEVEGTGPVISAKIVILGASGVGKTAISVRYIENSYTPVSKTTIGAAFLTKTLNVDGVTLKLQVWDTAGQERFRSLAPMYYRGASAAILVYDITNSDTFTAAQDWVQELVTNTDDETILFFVGNKNDMQKIRATPKDKAKEFAESIKATYFETSAKEGDGINSLFNDICKQMVGQRKQYLQHIPSSGGLDTSHYIIQPESEYRNRRQPQKIKEGKACCEN